MKSKYYSITPKPCKYKLLSTYIWFSGKPSLNILEFLTNMMLQIAVNSLQFKSYYVHILVITHSFHYVSR